MWNSKLEFSDKNHLCKVTIEQDNKQMNFAEVIEGWKSNTNFRQFYISLLAGIPFAAVFWESPGITTSSVNKPYEFVVVDSMQLAKVKPNPSAFARHFDLAANDENVVAFENLSKDAVLVVPCPKDSHNVYTHLAKFVREGSNSQCHEFFHKLGEEIEKRLCDKPLWINTSGLGVYWLHARLDSHPKYYTFSAYKKFI